MSNLYLWVKIFIIILGILLAIKMSYIGMVNPTCNDYCVFYKALMEW